MMLKLIAVEILFILPCAWLYPSLSRHKRIVGGFPLIPGEYPWLVSFHYKQPLAFTDNSGIKHLCGGTLIEPSWVLTAGHCFSDEVIEGLGNPRNWDVVVGEYNQFKTDDTEEVFRIDKIFVHKNFTVEPLHNDIALIKLKNVHGVDEDDTIDLDHNGEFTPGKECTVAGWGQISNEPFGWAMYIPLKTTITIVSNEQCEQAFVGVNNSEILIKPFILCAGSITDHDACAGDSGGPLVCSSEVTGRQVLTGIVSTGEGCGDSRYPGIYTRVSSYDDWIKKVLTSNGSYVDLDLVNDTRNGHSRTFIDMIRDFFDNHYWNLRF